MGESADTQSALAAFEDQAVQETLLNKSMALADQAALQALGRDEIRAQMWADLGVIIMKDPTARSASDSLVYAWFSKYMKQTLIAGADAAVQEYVNWSGLTLDTYADPGAPSPQPKTPDGRGWCNYHPPGPYDTDAEYAGRAADLCKATNTTVFDFLSFSPPRPSVDQFVKYGQYDSLTAIQSLNSTVPYDPITNNDFAAHAGQVAAVVGEGSALAVWGSSVPIATALSVPLEVDNGLVAKLFPFSGRANYMAKTKLLGDADKALTAARDAYKTAIAAEDTAEAEAAAAGLADAVAARKVAAAAFDAAEAEAELNAGVRVFGAVAAVAGAIVDIVVTTTLGSIQINGDLEAPLQLSALSQGAHNNPPDLRAVLTSQQGYPGAFTTFLNLTFPEAEADCVGFVQIGNELRECANPPGNASPGGVPAWDTTEPQFLNGFESAPGSSIVTSWGQVPTIWLQIPDSPGNPPQANGTLFVRPHGNGWFILQQFLPDGRLTREWMSTSFPFEDWEGNTFVAERVSDGTGKYFFNIAPIGATANSLSCYPGGGGSPPGSLAWTSCVTDTINYIANGGRKANVLEMVHGYVPDPNAPPPNPNVALNGPIHVTQGQPVTYTASATDGSGTALTYDWLYSCNVQGQPESFCTVANHGPSLTVSFADTAGAHVGVNVTNVPGGHMSLTETVFVSAPANTISFEQPAAMAYTRSLVYGRGYPTQSLVFSASSSLPVTVVVDPASATVCSVSGTVVTALYVGTCTLSATQAGNSVFPAAAAVIRSFSVTPGDYVVSVGDAPLTYAEPAGALATSVLTLYAIDGISGSLGGCQRIDGLINGAGNVAADVGNYPLGGCAGLSSPKYNVLINAVSTVGPKGATLFNTTQQANTIGVAAMTATIVQANDGFPGDIGKARVDFLLFRSANATATPDFAVRGVQANVLGQVASTLTGLPPDTYRLVLRTSVGDFKAPDNSGPLLVSGPVAPALTQLPQNVTVYAGQTATFAAAASGNPTPSAQWAIVTSGPTITPIPGATSPTLTLSNVTLAQNGTQYIVKFTNSAGSANSGIVTLTVKAVAPVIALSPASASVTEGGTATFSAAATGNPTPTAQWATSVNGGVTWNPIAGATSTTLTMPNVTWAQNGTRVRCVFTNTGGSATSAAAVLTVIPLVPKITTQPVDTRVRAGGSASFTAAASGAPKPTIQWQRSTNGGRTWSAMAGATTGTLVVSRVREDWQGYLYRAVFQNVNGSVVSRAARLSVVDQ